PFSQVLIGRNVLGPSIWQSHRFHGGFVTSTRPKTVLTGVLPESLLVYCAPQCGHARRRYRRSCTCWATTKSCTPANSALPSFKFMPSVSIANSRPLDRQFPALFAAVSVYASDLDTDAHDHHLRPCAHSLNRALASYRLNRSGCSGPSSLS